MILDEDILLNNDKRMPRFGVGTWFVEDKDVEGMIKAALSLGYRRINIDANFSNLKEIGNVLHKSNAKQFVEVKLSSELNSSDELLKAINLIDRQLNFDNLDLVILPKSKSWIQTVKNWQFLSSMVQMRQLKAIGVSDFTQEELSQLISGTNVIPVINQTIVRIGKMDEELLEYCQSRGIVVDVYSPVPHGLALRAPIVAKLAKKYHVSINQLCLRYNWQLGVALWRQSTNKSHLEENTKIDFEISNQDMKQLKTLKLE